MEEEHGGGHRDKVLIPASVSPSFSQISHLDEVLASFRSGVEQAQATSNGETKTEQGALSSLESLRTLRSLLEEFRDDELEHLDTAVEHDAQQAPAHALLSAIVQYGCKGAIEIAKKI